MFKHVLRNALLPTIAVVATQTGYLLGGLVIVERAVQLSGAWAQEIVNHAVLKDFSVVQAGAMVIGATYLTATVLARPRLLAAESAHPLRERRMSAAATTPPSAAIPMAAPARSSRREMFTRLMRSPTFLIATFVIALFWTFCAIFGYAIAPHDPTFQGRRHRCIRRAAVPVRHRLARPRRALARDRGLRTTTSDRPGGDVARGRRGQRARTHARLLQGLVRRDRQPLHRRVPGDPGDHLPDRGDLEPRHLGADADRHDRPGLHADHRAHRARRGACRDGAGLRAGGQAAR